MLSSYVLKEHIAPGPAHIKHTIKSTSCNAMLDPCKGTSSDLLYMFVPLKSPQRIVCHLLNSMELKSGFDRQETIIYLRNRSTHTRTHTHTHTRTHPHTHTHTLAAVSFQFPSSSPIHPYLSLTYRILKTNKKGIVQRVSHRDRKSVV